MFKKINCIYYSVQKLFNSYTFFISGNNVFYYRGCGWDPKQMNWSKEDREWIREIDKLFTDLFGPDFCQYEYTELTKHCVVQQDQFPRIRYQHEEWEKQFVVDKCKETNSKTTPEPQHQNSNNDKMAPAPVTTASPSEEYEGSKCSETPKMQAKGKTEKKSNTEKVAPPPVGKAPEITCSISSAASASQQHDGGNTRDEEPNIADAAALQQGNSKCFAPERVTFAQQNKNNSSSSKYKPSLKGVFQDINLLTRGERASLELPEVTFIRNEDVKLVSGQIEFTDPLAINLRPSESAIAYARQLLKELSRIEDVSIINVIETGDERIKVKIGSLGTFSKDSIALYQRMCQLAKEAFQFKEEKRWLATKSKSLPDLAKVRQILCNSRAHDEVIREGSCIMDASDFSNFSTLACERYVNGFTIDRICLKFLGENMPINIVYLPSYSQTWAKQGPQYFRQMVLPFFGHCAVQDAKYILTPFHFGSLQHWGLMCFEVETKTVYFDDGLKINSPNDALIVIKNMLTGFELIPKKNIFQVENWNHPKLDLPLPRMNMPKQTKTGEGSASCGISVILAARDVIRSRTSMPNFQWLFKNMVSLRKELMAVVAQWKR